MKEDKEEKEGEEDEEEKENKKKEKSVEGAAAPGEEGADFVEVDIRTQKTKWQGGKPQERRRRGRGVCIGGYKGSKD